MNPIPSHGFVNCRHGAGHAPARLWKLPEEPDPASLVPGKTVLHAVRHHLIPVTDSAAAHDALMGIIGDATIVLLGGASHGTHEFHRQRAAITRRLIVEKGFNAVAVECGWSEACRVNRFVHGGSDDFNCVSALAGFDQFPSWMWRNAEVLDFVGWLRDHNEHVDPKDCQTGFHGLDLFSFHKSMNEVIAYLDRIDPEKAMKARLLYGCIDRFGRDPQNYGLLGGAGVGDDCRAGVMEQLVEHRMKDVAHLAASGCPAADVPFFAARNARIVQDAGLYYRNMFRSYVSSWNLREEKMMETLVELVAHLRSARGSAKVVVWAHNSHVGDARATEMSWRGELSLGQLVREAYPRQSRSIGFTTYGGAVTAASGWALPAARMQVLPALEGSVEKLFHQTGTPDFMLDLTAGNMAVENLSKPRLQRAIGVVCQPGSGFQSHYFEGCLANQFDAVFHHDLTQAVEPLELVSFRKNVDAA